MIKKQSGCFWNTYNNYCCSYNTVTKSKKKLSNKLVIVISPLFSRLVRTAAEPNVPRGVVSEMSLVCDDVAIEVMNIPIKCCSQRSIIPVSYQCAQVIHEIYNKYIERVCECFSDFAVIEAMFSVTVRITTAM